MAEIELAEITKRYPDGTEAVAGLNLTVADGELLILVGPSGCGKSTVLRMIAGLEAITSGVLRIGDRVVNHLQPKHRDVAMVFQNYALYPHLSVRDNIGFPLLVTHTPKRDVRNRVAKAAELLELTPYLERRPAQLSGGQRQRVAMGRAIIRNPQAYLMDEPLSNLDAQLRVEMRTSISLLQRRLGTTTVFVTHDQTEAMTLGDRVVVMRGGVVQQTGSPKDVYEQPCNMFVAGFVGSPPMSFLPAERDGEVLQLPIGAMRLTPLQCQRLSETRADTGPLVVGIRAEHWQDEGVTAPHETVPVLRMQPMIDLVESLGSDIYVYFRPPRAGVTVEPPGLQSDTARALSSRMAARLAPTSSVREDERALIWIDTRNIHIFDGKSGVCLS